MPLTPTPSLFDADLTAHEPDSVEERAARWIESHPEIVAAFVARARDRANAGLRLRAKDIAAELRDLPDLDYPRINNSYIAPLARHVEDTYPDLRGLFRHRKGAHR